MENQRTNICFHPNSHLTSENLDEKRLEKSWTLKHMCSPFPCPLFSNAKHATSFFEKLSFGIGLRSVRSQKVEW